MSFPTRNAIGKLAQVHGLSKKGGPLSPRLCFSPILWPSPVKDCIAQSLLSVEEKVEPQKPQKPPPSWKGVAGIPAKDLILRWAYSSLHAQATKSPQGVPRGTPREMPLSRSNQEVLEGVHALGSLRILARSTVSNSSFFLQGLPYPRNGGTAQPNLPGGFFGPPRIRWILTP